MRARSTADWASLLGMGLTPVGVAAASI
jgi:hypothetical protein